MPDSVILSLWFLVFILGFRVVELEPALTRFHNLVLEFAKHEQTLNKELFTPERKYRLLTLDY